MKIPRRVASLVMTALLSCVTAADAQAPDSVVRVRVRTELGEMVLELDSKRAPATTANFLRYVDEKHYDGGLFHRTVTMDNQPESTVKIEVIQAGINPDLARKGFPPIALEPTTATGILHKDGVVSMARTTPNSATSGWFICINDQPSLDFGGARNPDGQGFAAFGRVVSGMDVARTIQQSPSSTNRTTNTEAQRLTPPIKILEVVRVP
jgi:peptidyl-prolyl cis-trans isomerase A (cyclophilin A)